MTLAWWQILLVGLLAAALRLSAESVRRKAASLDALADERTQKVAVNIKAVLSRREASSQELAEAIDPEMPVEVAEDIDFVLQKMQHDGLVVCYDGLRPDTSGRLNKALIWSLR